MMASNIGSVPIYSNPDSLKRHKSKSKRTRSTNPTRNSDTPRSSSKAATTSLEASTSHSARPALTSRTTSAPIVPLSSGVSSYSQRDSVTSIKDDPFFRNYQNPQSVSLARELRSASYSSTAHDDDATDDFTGQMNTAITAAATPAKSPSHANMENINIAVIGAAGVGKSTLIQRALGLRSLPTAMASSLKMSVDNIVYTVSLIEFSLETFEIGSDRRVQWPKQINGQVIPRIDGSLILYDVMNRDSITDLPQALNALVQSTLPTILVSCKCDNPVNTRQIDTDSIEAACLTEVETVRTAANVPESARLCLGAMLRAIMASRNAAGTHVPPSRRRAASSANLDTPTDVQEDRPTSQQSKHSRASSEYSILRGFPSPPLASSRGASSLTRHSPTGRTNLHYQYSIPAAHTAPPLSAHPAFRNEPLQENSDSETGSNVPLNPRTKSITSRETGEDSFLDMEESESENNYRPSDDIPILQRSEESDPPARVAGVTLDELVDRLLSQGMSKADSNFCEIFLCLYRKFAAPGELFSAILARLANVAEDNSTHYLTRTTTQLRFIAIIVKWVSSYPGDFASPQTSQRLNEFIEDLSAEPAFAAAAQEMRTELQLHVVEDDDTGWARTDADVDAGLSPGDHCAVPTKEAIARGPSAMGAATSQQGAEDRSERRERRVSEAVSVASGDVRLAGDPMAPVYHTVEDYEIEAATLVPNSTLPLTKFRYHICMDTSDDDFAEEITRIDWVMFSSIRVRDLVRHVSLPLEQKERCKSLANVNRMIDHFNHIAKWVANMILMRDKAKHRALMVEKFMRIALKLRQLNNYNGLAAVIAGINGTAVHRLAQTRALVPTECVKRFMRLELLMSTQKSHFAYRLAWANSPLPRIPFVPLHRRDLVSAEEGSRTFVGPAGDRINWKKFEILSDVLLPIMRSQGTPYAKLEKHESARELILDCRMPTDDEEIYQRSLHLETSSAGMMDAGKKKFPWFQK